MLAVAFYERSFGVAVHVAILVTPYDRLILEGRKVVECRLTKTPMPPFGCIVPGERIYFKVSGGPFVATAVVDRVWMADRLTPDGVDRIRHQFDKLIHGAAAYWASRRNSRYATLLWLRDVEPTTQHPRYKPQNMRAWYTLPSDTDPRHGQRIAPAASPASFNVKLTAGSLRQSQLRLTAILSQFPADALGGKTRRELGEPITLHLAGADPVETDIVAHQKMFRWRGWRSWFARHGLQSGDQVRFTPRGRRGFIVDPVRSPV